MNLERHISTGPLHPEAFQPPHEFARPMTLRPLFRKVNPLKEKDRFNLIFAPGLLPNHALTGPYQTAVFQLRAAGHIDPFDLSRPQTPPQLAAIHPIPLLPSLFVFRRHIRRVGHSTGYPFLPKLIMNPKPTEPSFLYRVVRRTRKISLQIIHQKVYLGRLREGFMLANRRMNAHAPTLFVHIQTDVNRLTRKINFVTLNHGKSPFGVFFYFSQKTITENSRLAFPFSSIRSGGSRNPVFSTS
jgi:hypothetical protein